MATGQYAYRMTSNQSGRAVIINNRPGTDKDDLKKLFEELNFKAEIHNNKTGQDIKDVLYRESIHPDHKSADAFITCVLSNGNKDCLYGVDGKDVKIDDILTMFDVKHCSKLLNKPKIFIFQGAMSTIPGYPSPAMEVSECESVQKDAFPDKAEYIHDRVDMLTVTDYVSNNDPHHLTCFVKAIVDIFIKYKEKEHITEMLTKVTQQVAHDQVKITDYLTRKMYFFPYYNNISQ